MWFFMSLVGLACAIIYGLGISYTNSLGLHPFVFVALWIPGTMVGLSVLLTIFHIKGEFNLSTARESHYYWIMLLPIAGVVIGTLMNVSIPIAIAGAPNPGFVFAIAACAAPVIGLMATQLGFSDAGMLSIQNKIGLVGLPFVVLLATWKG